MEPYPLISRSQTKTCSHHDRRCLLHSPLLRNGEWRRQRLTFRTSTSTPLARPRYAPTIRTSTCVRPRFRFAPSNTPCRLERPRRSRRARLTPVTLAASARSTSNAPPLRDHEHQPRNQRQQNDARPQSRFVRAQSRCSSRASLPLTPQAGTPAATIGMRPATRSGQRQS